MGLMRTAVIGGMVGKHSAKKQMEGMQKQAQAQQAQQAQQPQAQQPQVSATSEHKTDPMQEIAKLGELKQKGLLTEEEFQTMKAKQLAKM